ncbi:MAG: motility associated factor glycosyltransferase family protein [Eubacterium sp.]|nr:motility associated factor glycosyltransferase family protein [Eubacterium sp.]
MNKTIHNKLRDFSDNNAAFKKLYLEYRHIQFTFQGIGVNTKRKKRQKGAKTVYDKLLDYKGIHNGERCFIIATGPSLTMDDLESLKGEYTIAMNSICKLYDKTDWRPTYYAVQDNYVFDNMQGILREHKEVPVFLADNIWNRFKREPEWIEFPFDSMYHAYDMKIGKLHAKFSGDAYDIVYDGYSIAYSCLELAVYMGFKEIYLLGCDCTYLGAKEHFVDSGVEDRNRKNLTPMLFVGYEEAKRYADSHDIKIYNATRGGVLEVFPRVNFDDIEKKEF